jgi:uncharacterized protein (DUF1800 family)
MTRELDGAIAATRFGLGARPGQIERASQDPHAYLTDQVRPEGAPRPEPRSPGSGERLVELKEYQRQRMTARQQGDPMSDPVKMAAKLIRDDAGADFMARVRLAATTDDDFAERWALFFANHFTVSAAKVATATLIGPFEQEVIRPHAFGRFEDMLVASSRHPAMLIYLDQAQSIGPDSPAATRAARAGKKIGLNENLAREIMELHTVGLEAGYSQADVTEFARAMTGWSLGRLDQSQEPMGFMFRAFAHEPGVRTVMGRRYADDGEGQARAVLADLAASPHTARHLALKIGRHFVSDDPPASLTARLSKAYMESGGRLDAVARSLIASPEAWTASPAKFKTPYEFLVSSWRAMGAPPDQGGPLVAAMTSMGQKPFSAPSPKGWPEEAAAWASPDSIIKRMAWSEAFAAQTVGQTDPTVVAENALGGRLGPLAGQTIARAETRPEGLSILLMSPEFQRR